jgi:hypothetical protein
VPASAWWRRVRQHFGISAPRMAVRTHLPWWGRLTIVASLLVLVGGMWWWGFDFGQIFSGFNRKEVESRLVTLEADAAHHRDFGLERGVARAQDAMARQTTELSGENAQLKDELAFLQKLVSDSSKTVGLQIQRVAVEPDGEDVWRYSLLIVRGGSPKEEFVGTLALQATIAADPATHSPLHVIQLPEYDPSAAPALTLKFKYYQRVEGRFRVPPGRRVTALAVRAFETGQGSPRATRTLTLG